jgi:hypothetical protein
MIQKTRHWNLKELSTGDWSRLMLKQRKRYMRPDILTPVLMFHVFWDVIICKGRPWKENLWILQNAEKHTNNTASHPTTPESRGRQWLFSHRTQWTVAVAIHDSAVHQAKTYCFSTGQWLLCLVHTLHWTFSQDWTCGWAPSSQYQLRMTTVLCRPKLKSIYQQF